MGEFIAMVFELLFEIGKDSKKGCLFSIVVGILIIVGIILYANYNEDI